MMSWQPLKPAAGSVCVCVSAGIWRVKGLRLGAVGVETGWRGRGTSQVGKGPTRGLHKIYIIPTSAMQFVPVELSHCRT